MFQELLLQILFVFYAEHVVFYDYGLYYLSFLQEKLPRK